MLLGDDEHALSIPILARLLLLGRGDCEYQYLCGDEQGDLVVTLRFLLCVIGMSYTLHSKSLFSYCTSLVSILEVLSPCVQQGE